MSQIRPQVGERVIYVSDTDHGPGNDVLSPALILRTKEDTVLSVLDAWHDRPEGFTEDLGKQGVDLVVFGLTQIYHRYTVGYGFDQGQWFYTWQMEQYRAERR